MKPYVVEPKQYHLVFAEDTPHHGIEAMLYDTSIEEGLAFDRVWNSTPATQEDAEEKTLALFGMLADHVAEWNLTHPDGTPIKPVLDDLVKVRDRGVVTAILVQWRTAMIGGFDEAGQPEGADPLDSPPSSPEAGIPMQPIPA